jgi:hypothetical protein
MHIPDGIAGYPPIRVIFRTENASGFGSATQRIHVFCLVFYEELCQVEDRQTT